MLGHLFHAVDGRLHHVGLMQHVGHLIFLVLLVHLLGDALHADLERDRGVLDRLPCGAGDGLHAADSRHPEDRLGDLVDDQEVREFRRSWSLSIISSSGFIRACEKCRSAAA